MRRLYIAIPIVSVAAFFLSFLSPIFTLAIFFILPIAMFYWLKRHNAFLFLKSSTATKRLCLFAMSNKGIIPFMGEKVNEKWLKIENYWISIKKNSEYIYRDKVVMLAQQRKNMNVKDILKLKDKLSSSFFSTDVLFDETFLKSIVWPTAGTILLFLNIPIPNMLVLAIMIAGPHYMLYEIYKTGALEFVGSQAGNEITILYIRSSRKLKVAKAEAVGQKWWSFTDGTGHVKTLDGTDYFFGKKRIYISGAGCPTTFNLEHAVTTSWLRDIGLRGWDEFKAGTNIVEKNLDGYENYDSFEEAYQDKGQDFIDKAKKKAAEGGVESGRKKEQKTKV